MDSIFTPENEGKEQETVEGIQDFSLEVQTH